MRTLCHLIQLGLSSVFLHEIVPNISINSFSSDDFSLGGAEASEAPDFTLRDAEGKYFNISDYGNDTLVLFFMFTTCPVCEIFEQSFR